MSNDNNGGFVRYSVPCPVAEEEAANRVTPEANRVNTGTTRYTIGGGVEETGVSRHTVSQDGVQGGSVMATLRTDGPTKNVEIEPGNPSSRTSIAVALRMGAIREIGPGLFEDVAPGKPGEVLQDLDNPPAVLPVADPGAECFDADNDKLFSKIIEPLEQHVFDSTAASVTLAVVQGNDLSSAAKSFSQATGMDPDLSRQFVEAGAAHYERTAMAAVSAVGVGESQHEAFKAFARGQQGKLQEAVEKLLHQRDPSGFQEMATAFRRTNPGEDVAVFRAAGFETSFAPDGDLLLKRPGGNWQRARDLQ